MTKKKCLITHVVKESFKNFASNNPEEIINKLVQAGDEWMNGTAQADDISMVVVEVR